MFGDNLTRSDLRLIQQAIRNHSPVSEETRKRIASAVASQNLDAANPRLREALLQTATMMANAG